MESHVIISIFDSIPIWVMILPIILCSVIALAVIIERLVFYKRINFDYTLIIGNVSDFIKANQLDKASILCERYGGVIIRIIKTAISNLNDNKERVITEASEKAVKGIEKNVNILATIATIAPMLGLLGTVTGMMKSFSGLSKIGPAAHDLLAYGIAEALITTALGLIVAIPSLIFYNIMVARVEYYIKEVERVANVLLTTGDVSGRLND
ncbi:MAG: MotA/TolQ/ExbB proton channel family protein [Spirochaetes bacterium]|nr:MotA/TolQ/ExbB proton channel family protein [Spirochaetota bacterium]